jgi:UDP-3-O-[3-hydroxymyristoyl] glucosamine N-acyltransferase
MGEIALGCILDLLGSTVRRVVGPTDRIITSPAPIRQAKDENSITFCVSSRSDALDAIRSTGAGVVLCPEIQLLDASAPDGKTLVVVDHPRLAFIRVMQAFFAEPRPQGIHPTAVIDPGATIHPDTYIGPFAYIGRCIIGQGSAIHGHVHIYDNVRIGKNVVIRPGTVLGVDGFGYERNDSGELEFFPSIGGVIIEDDVEIHSNVNVDRGTLADTVIGRGTKIDKFCHIGHNVVIGKHCVITAHSMLGGGAEIGDYVWIAPCVCVRDGGIRIGSRAFIGMAAVVTKDVLGGTTVMGAPARPIEEQKLILRALRRLAQDGLASDQ